MKRPKLVGIVNVTPDSFSDGGGNAFVAEHALAKIAGLIEDGVDVIDIGAESTRPNADPLTAEEEWARLQPVLVPALERWGAEIHWSVDTRHAETANRSLGLGVDCINDVSAASNQALLEVIAGYPERQYVLMHSLTVPVKPGVTLPEQCDVIQELQQFAEEVLQKLQQFGILREQLIFDPGIGFGKTAAQSWEIIRSIAKLNRIGLPLYVGHSRKSFLMEIAGENPVERDAATLAVSLALASKGVDYLRVHDVKSHRQAFDSWEECNV